MRVVDVGNIGERTTLENVPKCGVIIEATPEELRKLPQVLYKEVELVTRDSQHLDRKEVKEESDDSAPASPEADAQ